MVSVIPMNVALPRNTDPDAVVCIKSKWYFFIHLAFFTRAEIFAFGAQPIRVFCLV